MHILTSPPALEPGSNLGRLPASGNGSKGAEEVAPARHHSQLVPSVLLAAVLWSLALLSGFEEVSSHESCHLEDMDSAKMTEQTRKEALRG